MRNWIIKFTSVFFLLLCAQLSFAGQNKVDWWKVQKDLTDRLWNSETEITQLAKEVCSKPPENGYEAIFKLSVLMRTGMNKEAIETLREIKELSIEITDYDKNRIFDDALDYQAWDLAKAMLEIFADEFYQIYHLGDFLNHCIESGWSIEQIDSWLAAMPNGRNNLWISERLTFNVKHDRSDKLIEELLDSILKNPNDIQKAMFYLNTLDFARQNNENWDLDWMTEIIKPKLITEAEKLASRLCQLSQWSTAKVFYEYALDMELTEDEMTQRRMMRQIPVSIDKERASYKVRIREDMSECLLNLDMKEQAQRLLVEAADIGEEYDLGLNTFVAGQVQAATGQTVIEDRILEEEKLSEDNPEYWRKRALYYRGLNEAVQEEDALKKGLALTTPKIAPEGAFKQGMDWRSSLLRDSVRFLKRQNRSEEAIDLLFKEISESPANSESAIAAVGLLDNFEKLINVDDEILWTWLENRTKWEHTERGLLYCILKKVAPQKEGLILGKVIHVSDISGILDKYFSRAEKLAFDNDPTRACTLGEIEKNLGFSRRSIALLKYAHENTKDKDLKEDSAYNLWYSYLNIDDWGNAEKIFPEVTNKFSYWEMPERYSQVAVAAAKAGAHQDAIRIWSEVANIYPAEIGNLDDLAEYGLKEELKDFYLEMQQKMPTSEVPAKALSLLEK